MYKVNFPYAIMISACMHVVMYIYSYLSLCEAVDALADVSSHLCQVMGLPSRDWADRGIKRGSSTEDHNVLSVPGSPGKHGVPYCTNSSFFLVAALIQNFL